MDIADAWALVQTGGAPFLLFIALLGVFRRWWYPGYIVRDLEKDRDEWKAIALDNLKVSSTLVDEVKSRPTRKAGG